MCDQLGPTLDPSAWIICGFSTPGQESKIQPELLTAFGPCVGRWESHGLSKSIDPFAAMLGKELKDRVAKIADFFEANQGLSTIEGTLGETTRLARMKLPEKLSFQFSKASLEASSRAGISIKEDSRALKRSREKLVSELIVALDKVEDVLNKDPVWTDPTWTTTDRKLGLNVWLNFLFQRLQGAPQAYMKARRIAYPNTDKGGTVLWFSSLNPGNNAKQAELLELMSEVLQIASVSLVTPLMIEARNANALRSAVSAIMARNMSHNIGSHVLTYLSDDRGMAITWLA